MIVSGGKILAIGKVNTDGTTVSGDGVKVPLGVNGGIKTYSVEAGGSNVSVGSAFDGNRVVFKVSAAGGGSGGGNYQQQYPVVVDNVGMTIGLSAEFINSASSGYNAMKAINENSAAWSKDTTYKPGSNIDITDNTISARDWTPELNTKVNADLFNTWSAGVESSAANLSAAIDNLPKPKYYDDVSATVADNSANWNSVYGSVDTNSANWNTTYSDLGANSAKWNDTTKNLADNSANWNTTYSDLGANSAKWNDTTKNLADNSANWNSTYTDVSTNSAKWNDTTKTLTDNSANWNSVYGTVGSSSADWNEVSAKLNSADFNNFKDGFNTWSAGVESSAANLSAAIDALPNYDDVRESVALNSANWNEVSAKLNTATFSAFQTGFNTWSAGVESSAASMSAYIKSQEEYWNNSSFNVQSKTPELLTVASSYDPDTRTITYDVSAKEQKNYSAGNWIDSEKLSAGTVEVSGQKTFKTQLPLYFSADASDPNIVWLLHDDEQTKKTAKACLIANGWAGTQYYDNNAGLSASIPASDINAEYIFHFARQMGIQININAKFIAYSSATDKIGKVGFGAATINGQEFTNAITYSMLGALGEQYYAASTIARIAADNFPVDGIDLSFKFVGDSDFLKEIQNPCITVHEIIDEA